MDADKNSTPLHLNTPESKGNLFDKQTIILILSILFLLGGFFFWLYVSFLLK